MKTLESKSISRGLPQGGVISPLMWNLFLNEVADALKVKRSEYNLPVEAFLDVLYADDIATVIWAETEEELAWLAKINLIVVKEVISSLGLSINIKKTRNLRLRPSTLPRGFFRREPTNRFPNTRNRLKRQYRQDAKWGAAILDFDPFEELDIPSEHSLQELYPVPLQSELKILGVRLGDRMTQDSHFTSMLAEAEIRRSLLRSLSKQNGVWNAVYSQ